ncbi:MAG: hypothetical protein EHM48_00770 [Planctomycetaceae bacterium]|nr:MAG: hypothetical protein EHM48_00770 [Planctomycetaceae bacterium]
MPIQSIIKGLSDRGMAFPEIGSIRKGSAKVKNGDKESMGKNLDYFRVVFDEGEAEAARAFEAAFTDKPKQFIAVLPFNEIERCWDFWREAYVRAKGSAGGMMIHRCDGEYVNFARDPQTKEITVINGLDKQGRKVACHGEPVASYKNHKGETVNICCRQVGRLRLIVPALGRSAYMVLHTTSWYDVQNITGNLESIRELHGGRIIGVPLIVKRRKVEINTPYGRRMESLVFIEADSIWVKAKLAQMHQQALPGNGFDPRTALPAPATQALQPSGPEWTEVGEEEEVEIEEESASEADALSPESIRAKVAGFVGARQGQAANAKQIGLACSMLEACYNADADLKKEMRHRTFKFLFGVGSSKELGGAHHLAILDWLKPDRGEDGKYHPSDLGAKEARIVEHAALMSEGQLELPAVGVEESIPF